MTCFDEEPNWDAGTENAYEQHRARLAAWDDDGPDMEAYELDDPKHPTFYERMVDIADLDAAA